MITQNELYDLSFTLTLLRGDLKSKTNIPVITTLIDLFEKSEIIENNKIRDSLSKIDELDKQKWAFVYVINYYTRTIIIKNLLISEILIQFLLKIESLLSNNEYEHAYDLTDAFHTFPEIVADNRGNIPREYWKTYVEPYRKKWDKNFLKLEEKKSEHKI